jgi:hypothetical protein
MTSWADRVQKDIDSLPGYVLEGLVDGLEEAVMKPVDKPGEVEQPFFVTEAGINDVAACFQVLCLSRREPPLVRVPANPGRVALSF